MSRTYQFKWRSSLAILLFALLIALTGVMATQNVEASDKTLSFENAPLRGKVRSGTEDKNVIRVSASGAASASIRYSISGSSAFKIGKRSGRVIYDGSPISSRFVHLTVTARDRTGEYASRDAVLKVAVKNQLGQASPTPAQPQRQAVRGGSCMVGQSMYAGDQCNGPGSTWHNQVEIRTDGVVKVSSRCWLFARCTTLRNASFTWGWLRMEKGTGGEWIIRCVSANTGGGNTGGTNRD